MSATCNADRPITAAHVDQILDESIVTVDTMGRKTTIAHAQLPNGYEITVSSACTDPNDFDRARGAKVCKRKLRSKVFDILAIQAHIDLQA